MRNITIASVRSLQGARIFLHLDYIRSIISTVFTRRVSVQLCEVTLCKDVTNV